MTAIQSVVPTIQQSSVPLKTALVASSFSWQKGSMMAAVAAAIAGIAMAVFSSSALAIAGFCLLGITGSVGVFISNDILDSKKLTKLTGQIADQNQKIEHAQSQANTIIANLSVERASLAQAQTHLQLQLEQLLKEKVEINNEKTALSQNNERLEAINGLLRITNEELNKKLASFTNAMHNLDIQMHDFLSINNKLTSNTEAIEAGASDLSQAHQNLTEVFEDFNADFEGHVAKLSQQLSNATNASELFLKKFNQEKNNIDQQLGSLQEISEQVAEKSAKLESLVEAINEKQKTIEDFDKKIFKSTEELTLLQKALDQNKAEEIEKTRNLQSLMQAIDNINDQIAGKLALMQSDLQNTLHNKMEELKGLDAQINLKQEILSQIDKKIVIAKDQLHKIATTPEPNSPPSRYKQTKLTSTLADLKHVGAQDPM